MDIISFLVHTNTMQCICSKTKAKHTPQKKKEKKKERKKEEQKEVAFDIKLPSLKKN